MALVSASGACGATSDVAGETKLAMGNNSTPDATYLPLEMALETMRKDGISVKPDIQFQSAELSLQALASNQVQFLSVPIVQAAAAVAKLPDLRVITTRSNNHWTFVTDKSITSCDQLDGKKVGIFSKEGVSTAYLEIYFKQQCPGVEPDYVVTADSTLRRQALENKQIVASPLQATDAVQILSNHPGDYHELVNFGQKYPTIGRDVVMTNKATLEGNPDAVRAFVRGQVEAIRWLYEHPDEASGTLDKLLGKHIPSEVDKVSDYVLDNKLFCANGGLADENLEESLKVFGSDYDFLPKEVTIKKLVDPGPMDAVLAKIKKSSATEC
ncbi:MAG: ABC transporter substrate-binding protein [Micromonosporaceae bacterium]